jgi:hypothetical protein
MALEGLTRAPMQVRAEGAEIVIEGEASSFRELARLCLLLGGANSTSDEFELTPGVHVHAGAPLLRLRLLGS